MSLRPRPPFFGPRRLRWRRVRLRDVVLLTLPVWLALAFVWGGAWLRLLEASRFDDWWVHQSTLGRLVDARLATLRNLPEAMSLRLRLDPESGDPGILRILVDRSAWAQWQREPLALHDVWLDAQILQGNDFIGAAIRKRGDTSVHWLTPKKSFTLRTGRGTLYKGHRRLAVSGKTPLRQWITDSLASDYGLLAPDTHLAPVFVNGRFYGVFRLVEDVDEAFLRAHGRLPGNIYRGDTAERGEVFPGRPRGLFRNLHIWDRVAVNDRPLAPPAFEAMADLLGAVAGRHFEDHRRLLARVDFEEWQRLFAYMLVTGDPYHISQVHNHFWYEDPSSGLLHLLPRDIRLRDVTEPGIYGMNDAFRALLRDPRLMDGALRTVAARLAAGTALGATEARLAAAQARFRTALRFDRLRAGEIPPVSTPEAIRAGFARNLAHLRRWLADARASLALGTPRGGVQPIDLRVEGRAAVELVALELAPEGPPPRLTADRDRSGAPSPGDAALEASLEQGPDGRRVLRLAEPLRLLPGVDTSAGIEPAPLAYRVLALGEEAAPVQGVVLRGGHDGAPVEAEPLAQGTPLAEGSSWHPWRFEAEEPEPRVRRLAGEVQLDETLRVAAHETLEIAPGTTLRLGPEVSILSFGRILAEGRADAPIRILPAQPARPWGAVVLQGRGSSGSRFQHVDLRGGSCATLAGVEYKGMVSVHRARDVRFERTRFTGNLRCDDALNAVHAEVDLLASRFERTNADAADYDHSRGRICASAFLDPGNDGLDLMGSDPWIEGSRMRGAGDKGISVGEASHPVVLRSRIEGSARGIEVKDASRPWLIANTVRGNTLDLHQIRKNWRYGEGGFARWVGPLPAEHEDGPDSRLATADPREAQDPRWALVPPRGRIAFRDGFEPPRDGFAVVAGRGRLERRRGDLVYALRQQPGAIARALDWDLARPEGPSRLVVQVAATALRSLRLRLEDDAGGAFEAPLPRSASGDRYAIAVLDPPAARYTRLRLEAEPGGRGAQVRLHEVRWVAPDDPLPRRCPALRDGSAEASGSAGSG